MNKERIDELDARLRAAQQQTGEVAPAPEATKLTFPENHLEDEENNGNSDSGDEVDQASKFERRFIAEALAKQQASLKPQTHPDFDGVTCVECGEDLPEVRLKMQRVYCTPCQEALDKLKKLRGY